MISTYGVTYSTKRVDAVTGDRFKIGNHRVSVSASIAIDLSQPRYVLSTVMPADGISAAKNIIAETSVCRRFMGSSQTSNALDCASTLRFVVFIVYQNGRRVGHYGAAHYPIINGHPTSVRLEPAYWGWLREIAAECGLTAKAFIEGVVAINAICDPYPDSLSCRALLSSVTTPRRPHCAPPEGA